MIEHQAQRIPQRITDNEIWSGKIEIAAKTELKLKSIYTTRETKRERREWTMVSVEIGVPPRVDMITGLQFVSCNLVG